MKNVFLLFMFFVGITNAQNIQLPSPQLGWDSLQSQLLYPEIAMRCNYETALMASIEVDSTANISALVINPFSGWISINNVKYENQLNPADSLFIESIKECCYKNKWIAGMIDGLPKTMEIKVPFIFIINHSDDAKTSREIIIKEIIAPELVKTQLH